MSRWWEAWGKHWSTWLAVLILGAYLIVAAIQVIERANHKWFTDGQRSAMKALRIQAVRRGHANWVVSDEGQVEFQWKDCGDTPEEVSDDQDK